MQPDRRARNVIAIFGITLLVACGGNSPTPTAPSRAPVPTATGVPATTASSNADGEVRLNPAHGEPGHVCEIPVGAPLDGSAATNSTAAPEAFAPPPPSMMNLPQSSGNTDITLPSGTPNPAHGEPGHRCEVSVGDPLP
ncbi:MAG: hypothetical protein KF797_12395 [Flavobacteriales bacterium]|nr:hypothetical protein [Flavobacteriales bacterium]